MNLPPQVDADGNLVDPQDIYPLSYSDKTEFAKILINKIHNYEDFLSWYVSSGKLIKYLPPPKKFPAIIVYSSDKNDTSYRILYDDDFK